jgi:hypothetical protein
MHYTILTHGTASFYDLGLGLARGFAELGIPCRVAGQIHPAGNPTSSQPTVGMHRLVEKSAGHL